METSCGRIGPVKVTDAYCILLMCDVILDNRDWTKPVVTEEKEKRPHSVGITKTSGCR